MSIATDDKCVVFQQTEQHQLVISDVIIDKAHHSTFGWKYTVDFEEVDDVEMSPDPVSADNVGTAAERVVPDAKQQGICMGFAAYPLGKGTNCRMSRLGTTGTQFGLAVKPRSRVARAYFTHGSIHQTSSFRLDEDVRGGDEFVFYCDAAEDKLLIYHNEQVLPDAFNSRIPKRIVPAVSVHAGNDSVSCNVDFVAPR